MRWLLRKPERDGSMAKEARVLTTLAEQKSSPAEVCGWQSILGHADQPETDTGREETIEAALTGKGCMVAEQPALVNTPGRGNISGRKQGALLTGVLPPEKISQAAARCSTVRERSAAVGFVKSAASAALRGLVCGSKQPRSPAESPEHLGRLQVNGVGASFAQDEPQEVFEALESRDTWAQQRREVSKVGAGERFGCFGGGGGIWTPQVFAWRRSASASREVAHRLRQRRHGCQIDRSSSARGRTASTTSGTPNRSQSCSPARSVLRDGAGTAQKTLRSPAAASAISDTASTSSGLRNLVEKSTPSREASLPSEVLPLSLLDVAALDIVNCGGSVLRSCSSPPALGLLAGPAPADVPSPARLSPAGVTKAAQEVHTWTWKETNNAPSTLPSLPWPVPRDVSSTATAGNNLQQADGSEMSPGSEDARNTSAPTVTFTPPSPVAMPIKADEPHVAPPVRVQLAISRTGRRATWGLGDSAIYHMSAKKKSGSRPSLREVRLHEAQQLLERMLTGGQDCDRGAVFGALPCHGVTMRNAAHGNQQASGSSTLRPDSGPQRSTRRHASAPPAGGPTNLSSDASCGGGALCSVAPPASSCIGASTDAISLKAVPLQPLNGCMPWFPTSALQDPTLPRSQDRLSRASAFA